MPNTNSRIIEYAGEIETKIMIDLSSPVKIIDTLFVSAIIKGKYITREYDCKIKYNNIAQVYSFFNFNMSKPETISVNELNDCLDDGTFGFDILPDLPYMDNLFEIVDPWLNSYGIVGSDPLPGEQK